MHANSVRMNKVSRCWGTEERTEHEDVAGGGTGEAKREREEQSGDNVAEMVVVVLAAVLVAVLLSFAGASFGD
jgi:hypothetical protein